MSALFATGRSAVIFGAADGIGAAAVAHCRAAGMKVVAVDRNAIAAADGVETHTLDVGDFAAMKALRDDVVARHGDIALLMNNAGHGGGGGAFDGYEKWRRVFDTNMWGVVHGVQAFTPALIAQKTRAAIVNTGSKQGLTNPPGDLAYNATKAAVRAITEGLQHTLRNTEGCAVSAHLLIPGFTYTGLIASRVPTKPAAAWTSEQVVAVMVDGVERGDFYLLCPDNETTLEMDARRIAWGAADIAANRPGLSRWHPDFKEAFAAHMAREK